MANEVSIPVGDPIDLGKIMIGLIVSLIVLMIIKQAAPRYAWWYVVVVLGGIVLYRRLYLTVFLNQLRSRL